MSGGSKLWDRTFMGLWAGGRFRELRRIWKLLSQMVCDLGKCAESWSRNGREHDIGTLTLYQDLRSFKSEGLGKADSLAAPMSE